MKTITALLWCCLLYAMGSAQPTTAGTVKPVNITTGDSLTAFRWLQIKPEHVRNFLHHNRSKIARQLSQTEFIVYKDALIDETDVLNDRPANNYWKLSPRLFALHDSLLHMPGNTCDFLLQSDDTGMAARLINDTLVRLVYATNNSFYIRAEYRYVWNKIIPLAQVVFADIVNRRPTVEQAVPGFDNTLNNINYLQQQYPLANGDGLAVSVKEDRPDTADIDFKNRMVLTNAASNRLSTHATVMSSIIAGAGNSFYTGRGVAPAATISSSSFDVLLPDSDAYYQRFRLSVQNHSYGTGIENFYGADALAYDASVINNSSLVHVFSAGNSGNLAPGTGQYTGLTAVANLTGSFKMAKNIITVGATDSLGIVVPLSSRGPAFDGRIKPDLVAFGQDGSSGAAALVSGTALVLQHIYKAHHGVLPEASLVKAVLLNTATDAGNTGIDFSAGYGSLDAYHAGNTMDAGQYFTGSVSQGQVQTFNLQTPINSRHLKIILAWTDPPAKANALTALVNDLDLTVTDLASGRQWQPWVLHSIPNKDSLQSMPVRQRDSLNTVEQITIDDSTVNNLVISVKGFNIPVGMQAFSIVYQWDTSNTFHWAYPTLRDNILSGRQQFLRWHSNLAEGGQLAFKYSNDTVWRLVKPDIALTDNHIQWEAPDTNAVALMRMTVKGKVYLSDSFTISKPLHTGVGYNCADTALLYWNKSVPGNYRLFRLENKYMEPILQTADTTALVGTAGGGPAWYCIAPVFSNNQMGVRSIAFNYLSQGTGCYYNRFTADLNGNTAFLQIGLGSNFNIATMTIEKKGDNDAYTVLQSYSKPIALQYSIEDKQLRKGANQYRVRIALVTGQIIVSSIESVFYMAGSNYIIYPNPVLSNRLLTFTAMQLNNQLIQVYNPFGQKVFEKKMSGLTLQLETGALARGVYFYIISAEGKKEASGSVVIQ